MDVTTLDIYKTSGSGKKFLNMTAAKEEKLLGKWYTIKEAYLAPASQFDTKGNMLEEKVEKLHLDFEEIPHVFTLNKTNVDTLVKDFGSETEEWIGELVKLRIHTYPQGAKGVVIASREDLTDEGESIPAKSVKDDKDKIKQAMQNSNAVRNAVDQLSDMAQPVTIENILKEVNTAKAQREITKAQYMEAVDALE